MFIPLTSIKVAERQRTTFDAQKLNDLRASLRKRGRLFNAIIVEPYEPGDDEPRTWRYSLVCGERRCRAMTTMHEEGVSIRFENENIPAGAIAATVISDFTLVERLRTEFDENTAREDLSWQDRDRALFIMHQHETTRNPEATVTQTAERIVAQSGGVGAATSVNRVRNVVAQAIVVAQHLDDPTIAKARNSNEAYALIMKREEDAINAELTRRKTAIVASSVGPTISIRQGDAFAILPTLADASFDLILTDPPYGVGAGAQGFRDRTVFHHNYDDSPERGLECIKFLLTQGWRIAKPTACLFIFGHPNNWDFFRQQAASMGWKPFVVPLIWRKSLSEGLAPWGRGGFRRTYEAIFFAIKGARGLVSSPTDVLEVKRVHRSERIYGAQKPLDLLIQLVEASTLPGDSVLDPFAGSGSTLAAAKRTSRVGLGIELDPAVVDTATSFIFKGEAEDSLADIAALDPEA